MQWNHEGDSILWRGDFELYGHKSSIQQRLKSAQGITA